MNKIYRIPEEVDEIQSRLDNFLLLIQSNELQDDFVKDTLDSLKGELEVKHLGVAASIKNIECEIKTMKEYVCSMNCRIDALDEIKEKISHYLCTSMSKNDIKKISSTEFDISLRKSYRIVIDDESKLEAYVKTTVVKSIDKLKIKENLELGPVDGAHLGEREYILIR